MQGWNKTWSHHTCCIGFMGNVGTNWSTASQSQSVRSQDVRKLCGCTVVSVITSSDRHFAGWYIQCAYWIASEPTHIAHCLYSILYVSPQGMPLNKQMQQDGAQLGLPKFLPRHTWRQVPSAITLMSTDFWAMYGASLSIHKVPT